VLEDAPLEALSLFIDELERLDDEHMRVVSATRSLRVIRIDIMTSAGRG